MQPFEAFAEPALDAAALRTAKTLPVRTSVIRGRPESHRRE